MAVAEDSAAEIPDDAARTILTVGDAVKFRKRNAQDFAHAWVTA